MLTSDPKRLRFFGIDLHSRVRRRVAVVITYLSYFMLMAATDTWFGQDVPLWFKYLCMFAATACFMSAGIFRSHGPLKRMTEKPTEYRDRVLLHGLDDWSRYLYGGNYESLDAEQQHDVLMRYKVGRYSLPASGRHAGFDTEAPDERELVERNMASTTALQTMTTLLFGLTGISIADVSHPRSFGDVPGTFMTLGLLAVTLPKAIIFWNEADPRLSSDLDNAAGPGMPDSR